MGRPPGSGVEVKLTEEQADAVRQARRRRDIGAGPDDASTKSGGTEKTPQTTPADDAQLRKAVEYLQQRLGAAGTKP